MLLMESYLYISDSIMLVIPYIIKSLYVQKLLFLVLVLLAPSMESHKINLNVVVTPNQLT